MPWLLGPVLAVIGSVYSEPAGRSLSSSSHSYRFVSPPVFPSWRKSSPSASRRMAEGDSSELTAFYYPLASSEPSGQSVRHYEIGIPSCRKKYLKYLKYLYSRAGAEAEDQTVAEVCPELCTEEPASVQFHPRQEH